MKSINITGGKYGRWTVLSRADNTSTGQSQWLCKCECGTIKILKSILIRRGISKSCGCLRLEVQSKMNYRHGHAVNGISPTYHTWAGMKARCNYSKHKAYNDYGGRGISVCERWNNFKNFFADMGIKPKGKSLDRIDTNGNYCKENCRWATAKEQARNKRNNRLFTIKGKTKTIAEWAEINGIHYSSMHERTTGKYYAKR